ncbi:hypothetical protein DFJ58DRAFT_739980 [Suillus subalutaceus]|uniref:uncharacterized protein n=1 Tax=Suillus subalutaceus TaxID=48586 RepID=UPI001B86ABF4|nr:uncharacterized protein DFJ58DRAFT_739980 [Suillus subalutaceus]KAG1814510.1 hypothetical protein DFJ58DRAFT_739980 [Suillus subalutaceus]
MLSSMVQDLLKQMGGKGSFIFVKRFSDVKPVFHIRSAREIIAGHFHTIPDAPVRMASETIHSKPLLLQAANDVSISIVFVKCEPLATYLVEEATKVDHLPYDSDSGIIMELLMRASGAT